MTLLYILIAAGIGYLLGSIPSGLLLTQAAGLGDIRQIGSGNIGATNVLRTGNKGLAAATLLADMLKGTVAVIGCRYFFGAEPALAAGAAAFFGHLFPVWLSFRGGKGVATYLGVLAGLAWPAALVFAAVWLAVAAIFRFSSLAALSAALAAPIALLLGLTADWRITALMFALSAVLCWTHRGNIGRLIAGNESRIGAKSGGSSAKAAPRA